jgi:DNA (cytosine-5)-methyltransferase 1
LTSLGYHVEHRVLNAADFGDATSRHRLFIRASKTARRIRWPEPTHAGRWRPAREIIDWSLRGESVFNRRRPLAPRTLDRIEAGLRKFGGEPFIAVLRGTRPAQSGSWAKSVTDPLGTISAGGIHAAICEPFILGQQSGGSPRGVSQPMTTICTESRGIALIQPFIVQFQGGENRKALRTHTVEQPLPTQPTENRFGLCQPFVLNVAHEGANASRVRSVEDPLPTIPAGHRGEVALCQPFLTKYNGTGVGVKPVDEPMDTITAKDRFALVEPGRLDIYFRMRQPHELAAAMGFDGYEFAGTKTDQVRQIGNAVAVRTAEALCGAMIDAAQNVARGGRSGICHEA